MGVLLCAEREVQSDFHQITQQRFESNEYNTRFVFEGREKSKQSKSYLDWVIQKFLKQFINWHSRSQSSLFHSLN